MTATKRGERTAAEIAEAARNHLLEVGPAQFSLREVARRADLSPSAVYNHFPSREALINELAFEAVRMLGSYFDEVTASDRESDNLESLCDAYFRFAREQPERYRLVFDMLVSPTPDWNQYAQVAVPFTRIVASVENGLASGEFIDAEGVGASGLAYGLWSLVHGAVMLSTHHLAAMGETLDPLRLAAVRAYVHGITPTRS